MTPPVDPQASLRGFQKTKDFFIGIDSDGCVFDTMEVKHKECFIPNVIQYFELAAISKYAREVAEFVNLYSQWRGLNRFPGLVLTLDLLADRPEVARRGFRLPAVPGLRTWLSHAKTFSTAALEAEVALTDDPDLVVTVQWSEAVNKSIATLVHNIPPFPMVRESLFAMDDRADIMVCSGTPGEALRREWAEHGLARHVTVIAGQECGNKDEHIGLAALGKYEPNKMLIIGDSLGDLKAADANGALFYPIEPGAEDDSWKRFYHEALPRFFAGTYAGGYRDELVTRFQSLLPTTPIWSTLGLSSRSVK